MNNMNQVGATTGLAVVGVSFIAAGVADLKKKPTEDQQSSKLGAAAKIAFGSLLTSLSAVGGYQQYQQSVVSNGMSPGKTSTDSMRLAQLVSGPEMWAAEQRIPKVTTTDSMRVAQLVSGPQMWAAEQRIPKVTSIDNMRFFEIVSGPELNEVEKKKAKIISKEEKSQTCHVSQKTKWQTVETLENQQKLKELANKNTDTCKNRQRSFIPIYQIGTSTEESSFKNFVNSETFNERLEKVNAGFRDYFNSFATKASSIANTISKIIIQAEAEKDKLMETAVNKAVENIQQQTQKLMDTTADKIAEMIQPQTQKKETSKPSIFEKKPTPTSNNIGFNQFGGGTTNAPIKPQYQGWNNGRRY